MIFYSIILQLLIDSLHADFGMIGYESHNNDEIGLAFDLKCPARVHSAELVSQSTQNNSLIDFIQKCTTHSLFCSTFPYSGYFYDEYLQYITLNNNSVEFSKMDLTYLTKVCSESIPMKSLWIHLLSIFFVAKLRSQVLEICVFTSGDNIEHSKAQ